MSRSQDAVFSAFEACKAAMIEKGWEVTPSMPEWWNSRGSVQRWHSHFVWWSVVAAIRRTWDGTAPTCDSACVPVKQGLRPGSTRVAGRTSDHVSDTRRVGPIGHSNLRGA